MLKRFTTFLLALSASMLAVGCSSLVSGSEESVSSSLNENTSISSVETPVYSENLTYSAVGDGYSVTGVGDCKDSHVIIPAEYEGKAVTAIGPEAFAYTEGIVSVTIPESVVKIDANAFLLCADLTSVGFENSVGWMALSSPSLISGDSLEWADPTQAATLLTTTYVAYYWVRY